MTPDKLLDYLDDQVRKLKVDVAELKEQVAGIKKQELHEDVKSEIDSLLANRTDSHVIKQVKDYVISVLERSKE